MRVYNLISLSLFPSFLPSLPLPSFLYMDENVVLQLLAPDTGPEHETWCLLIQLDSLFSYSFFACCYAFPVIMA